MNNISSPLFQNLDETEIKQMKAFSRMRKSSYMKGDLIFRTGDIVCEIGIVQKAKYLTTCFRYLFKKICYCLTVFSVQRQKQFAAGF